jgi:NAD(P)-dependent dehydrogenase (short-subunit alcohol dehydrogenase family)
MTQWHHVHVEGEDDETRIRCNIWDERIRYMDDSQSNIAGPSDTSAGHFYLTKLLLPVLTATAKKSPPGIVRVINVSSIAHYMVAREGIRWSTLGPDDDAPVARRKLGMARVYGQSKLVKCMIPISYRNFLNPLKGKYSVL